MTLNTPREFERNLITHMGDAGGEPMGHKQVQAGLG